MNGYGRLRDIKAGMAGLSGITSADDDLIILRDEVSRELDDLCDRWWFTLEATRLYSGDGCSRLWLGDDVISVTTLKVADTASYPSTFENTMVAGTDYALWPENAAPYRALDIIPSGQFGAWPTGSRNVQIAGKFGYSEEWESLGVTGTVADTTTLTITCANTGQVQAGDMVKLGSEQMGAVSQVSPANFVVETRGANGSTAAAQSGVAVYVRRYPRIVEQAVRERVMQRMWAYAMATPAGAYDGGPNGIKGEFSRWLELTENKRNPAAVF